jgi:DNA helicase-2/ATP-dependent DNA helicase PcrA
MICIAGAGSGKTSAPAAFSIWCSKASIRSIFSRSPLQIRRPKRWKRAYYQDIVGASESKKLLWMGTFHFGFTFVMEADKLGYPSNFTIYDSQDSQRATAPL